MSAAVLPPEGRAALRGGVMGNYVDQLHIFLPLLALAPALPALAGPRAGAATASLVVIAMLLGRPVGGMLFGRLSDRWGRTRTTRLAIAGTALCSLLIAAMPTHEHIGGLAIALVLVLRFVGGVLIAGEYSAAIPLAMEWSPPRRRGLVSGLIMAMAPWAQASIAVVTGLLLVGLGRDAYAGWGWRLSFVAGALASLLMLAYYRRHVVDAPEVLKLLSRSGDGAPRAGLREVLVGGYRSAFWQMFGLMTGLWFMTQMTVIALPPRLVTDVGLDAGSVTWVMAAAAVGQALVMSVTGHLSTLLGRRRFFIAWGLLALVAGPLLLLAAVGARAAVPAAVAAVGLQALTVTAYGPIGAYLCERFPAHVRSTGYGTAYSLSIVVPALYPFYLPALAGVIGLHAAMVGLLALGAVLVVACGRIGPALAPRDLEVGVEAVARRQVVTL